MNVVKEDTELGPFQQAVRPGEVCLTPSFTKDRKDDCTWTVRTVTDLRASDVNTTAITLRKTIPVHRRLRQAPTQPCRESSCTMVWWDAHYCGSSYPTTRTTHPVLNHKGQTLQEDLNSILKPWPYTYRSDLPGALSSYQRQAIMRKSSVWPQSHLRYLQRRRQ